jgi:thioredoxin 1
MENLTVQAISSQEDFQTTVLEATEPTLVYFWATWCTSCRALSPRVDALAQDSKAAFKVAKAEVSKLPELTEKYGIQSVPTMLLFKPGNPKPTELVLSTYVKDWAEYVNRRVTA